jgi:hypothetical protein
VGDAANIPAEGVLLCESCGYALQGLPEGGRCPECGTPIADSARPSRGPTRFEQKPSVVTLLRTAATSVVRPVAFFKQLQSRPGEVVRRRARWFRWLHVMVIALLAAAALLTHARLMGLINWLPGGWLYPAGGLLVPILGLTLLGLLWCVTVLTAWEAAHRGLRLPAAVIRRGLTYLLPGGLLVTLIVAATVGTYATLFLTGRTDFGSVGYYLYTLAGQVVLGGIYLFLTYWRAMTGLMYATR